MLRLLSCRLFWGFHSSHTIPYISPVTGRCSCWIKILSEPHFSQTRGGHTLPQPLQCVHFLHHTSGLFLQHPLHGVHSPPLRERERWVYFWVGSVLSVGWLGKFQWKSVCTVCAVPLSTEVAATFLFLLDDPTENECCGGVCGWRERPRPPDHQGGEGWSGGVCGGQLRCCGLW